MQLGSARHSAVAASHSDAVMQKRGKNVPSAHTHPPAWAPHTHLPGGTSHWPGNPDVLQHSAFERQLLPTGRHWRAYASPPPIIRSTLPRAIAARSFRPWWRMWDAALVLLSTAYWDFVIGSLRMVHEQGLMAARPPIPRVGGVSDQPFPLVWCMANRTTVSAAAAA